MGLLLLVMVLALIGIVLVARKLTSAPDDVKLEEAPMCEVKAPLKVEAAPVAAPKAAASKKAKKSAKKKKR